MHAKRLTHEGMRGPSEWSVGDRELMAAYVAARIDSPFCVGAHTATAARASGDPERVAAVLADLDSAPIEEGLRATLRLLGGDGDAQDALAVGFAFDVTGGSRTRSTWTS
jgi:AhpD family alkylhydroperoxidase